jgi:hypothetical protein
MPVSLFPLVLPIVFLILLIRGAIRGKRAFLRAVGIVVAIIGVVALPFYIPGWWLMLRRSRGDGASLYQLARWHENHCDEIGELILWPCFPDVAAGYRALKRSAAAGYTPAIYALGVRLKYGEFVPESSGWTGPGGNVFEQPGKGQPLIDQALHAGYMPKVEEKLFYWQEFRK